MNVKIIENMSNAEYHSHPAISKSGLDLINKSPAHYFYRENISTPEMKIGSAFHDLVLLPDTFNQLYAILPADFNGRTKEGKELKAKIEAENLTPLTIDEFEIIEKMKLSILAHPTAAKLLENGKAETSIFWQDAETGVECRCRPDFISDTGLIVDLKSTQDASPEGFAKSVANFRYHVQDSYYSEGYTTAFNQPPKGFVFIAVEKKPPYAVGVYSLDEFAKAEGKRQYQKNLLTYQTACQTKEWQAYSPLIETLSLPSWAFKI